MQGMVITKHTIIKLVHSPARVPQKVCPRIFTECLLEEEDPVSDGPTCAQYRWSSSGWRWDSQGHKDPYEKCKYDSIRHHSVPELGNKQCVG